VHRSDESSSAPSEPPLSVRLIREYKGPGVVSLTEGSTSQSQLLPGRMLAVLRAIERGRLAEADAMLDQAGRVLPGPWLRRSAKSMRVRTLLWLWLGVLAAASIVVAW
jgi:hypothetical protein